MPIQSSSARKAKSPRRIVYFANGDTMEEYSTEEEEKEQQQESFLLVSVLYSMLSWGLYLQFWEVRIATASFLTCGFLGGKLAMLFGLSEPKYKYAAIVEHYRARRR
ncbi:protein FAM177B [Anser cygnoides]|uniref:protein FAM177B n=1 Tax=Anser cygnoides TaxID=8845 RepID=UPI0034D1C510